MSTTNSPVSDSVSLAPEAAWCDHEHRGHTVQFYTEDESLINGLSRLVGTALGAGGSAIVVATEAHRKALAQKLQSRGLNTFMAAMKGRYHELDAAETLSKITLESWPDAGRFADLIGGLIVRAAAASEAENSRVVAFGEMVALLWSRGKAEAAIRLEQLWNDLAKTHAFSLRCAYPIGSFGREQDTEPFLKICAEHSGVIPSESYTELINEQERLRNISHLQQRALALETEKAQHKEVQQSLHRRESELADILENAVEGVQQVGPDRRILWTNKALLNLLGYSADEYVGHQLGEFHVHPDVFETFWAKLMRQEEIYDYAAELRCQDGSVKQVLIYSNGLWEHGRFVHTRCFVRDVTEQKRLEQSLRDAEKQAAMGRVAAIIAHEINNPLETVMNTFYLLREHPSLDEDARKLMSIANEEMARMRHIAKQTLAFYRNSDNPVPVSLRHAVEEVLTAYSRKIQLHRITVEKNIATDGSILAFPVEIRQVFVNLLGNAVQAMPEGGTLRITLRHCSEEMHRSGRPGIRINITDTGVGIPAAFRHKIFEPFFTMKAEKGTGLGLWVSRGIVQKLEGTIRFRSAMQQGKPITSFAVFIPTDGTSAPVA
jgi:PAS domain S-box-containing protein